MAIRNLDVVVGIDFADENTQDEFRILSDIATSGTELLSYPIPSATLQDSTTVPDTVSCVDGGDRNSSWGFVYGTQKGTSFLRSAREQSN